MLLAALATAKQALPLYSHRNSPRKFTQHQLFACLVLKNFLKTDYRGVVAHLADCPSLAETLSLTHVPHYDTSKSGAATVGQRSSQTLARRDGPRTPGTQTARATGRDRLDRSGIQRAQDRGGPGKTGFISS